MLSASEVLQGAYAGAQEAGHRILGLCDVDSEIVLSGSKDAPVELGYRVTLTVREAEDGRLLPRREDAGPGGPSARWLLKIDVYPLVEFDAEGEGRIAWVAHVRRIDVATSRVVGVGMSGLSRGDQVVLQDDRPVHEYLDDPVFLDAIRGAEATDPSAAVAEAMRRLTPRPVVTPGRRRRALIAGGIVAVAGVGIGLTVFAGGDDAAPSPNVSSTTISNEANATTAGTDASEPTTTPEPLRISTGTVLVFEGTQDSVQTWDVGDALLVNDGTLADSLQFFVLASTSDGNNSVLALASPPECASGTDANCGWVLEVYEHAGAEQHSSAAEVGTSPLGFENTFLSDTYDQGTRVDVAEGCNASMTRGELPVHLMDADDAGIGVYFPNADNSALIDSVFIELGPPTEVQIVVVELGDSTAIAIATPDAIVSGCVSSSGMSTETFMDTLDPAICEAEESDSGIEFCDGPQMTLDELAEVLRAQPPTPAIEDVLRQIEVGNFVGFGDEVGAIADALALYLILTQ